MPPLDIIIASLLSAIIGGGLGALTTHYLTRRREAEKQRKEVSLSYRVEAWRGIADQTDRKIDAIIFEKALSDVILFGTEEEIQLASKIMDEFVANSTADTTVLLKELRKNIRTDLGLVPTSIEFRWLRIKNSQILGGRPT